jgi:tripartite-type tricarboxylate transporter receptor subunit TctC
MVHIPYKGQRARAGPIWSAATVDVFVFNGLTSALALIKGGKLRALAVAQPRALAGAP